jgi:hypothetical protein
LPAAVTVKVGSFAGKAEAAENLPEVLEAVGDVVVTALQVLEVEWVVARLAAAETSLSVRTWGMSDVGSAWQEAPPV